MKNPIFTIALISAFLFSTNSQGQFLKKLGKKVEDRVENTVINKTSNKAGKETGKAVDKVLEPETNTEKSTKKTKKTTKKSKKNKSTSQNFSSSYDFDYQYRLTVTTSKEKMDIDYFLKPNASYMGTKMNQGIEMFMVMDGDANSIYMFMETAGRKIATSTSLGGNDIINSSNRDDDYTITDLPPKTIMGYKCLGKQMENDEYVIEMYYTTEAEVSFNEVFKSNNDQIPDAMKAHLNDVDGGLMMYMDMVDKKNKGKKSTNTTMECTMLEPNNFTFNTDGYTQM